MEPEADLRAFSCLICRQRKVKCDRRTPCSNCVRAEKQCSFIAPVRGKRKRSRAPKEGLHAKLKRYEDLLKAYGARLEPAEAEDGEDADADSETASPPEVEMAEVAQSRIEDRNDPYGLKENKPMLITKGGASRYLDRCVIVIIFGTSILTGCM